MPQVDHALRIARSDRAKPWLSPTIISPADVRRTVKPPKVAERIIETVAGGGEYLSSYKYEPVA